MRKNTRIRLWNAVLSLALLGGASSVSADDPDPTDGQTGHLEERGTYPLFVDGVSAVLRVEDTYTSVTTRVDGPAAENWHMVMLQTECDGGVGPIRAIVFFDTSMKVTFQCPNPDPADFPPEYFVMSASATLTDVDDASFDPEGQLPSNDRLVSVGPPGPNDIVPARPDSAAEEP